LIRIIIIMRIKKESVINRLDHLNALKFSKFVLSADPNIKIIQK